MRVELENREFCGEVDNTVIAEEERHRSGASASSKMPFWRLFGQNG
jgi:hypothetical protein